MNTNTAEWAVAFALLSSFCFSGASVYFARYSRQISPLWVNTMKALICGAAISLTLVIADTWDPYTHESLVRLLLSGAIGLGVGDLFLMAAFARMGASRTLLIFGFQPVIMAFAAALLFGQALVFSQALGVVFLILCLVTLSFERYRQDGHWETKGLSYAFLGVLLDNAGVLLTRSAFELSPELAPLQANLFRIAGALGVYGLVSLFQPMHLVHHFKLLPALDKRRVIIASLLGTFLSLALYLRALKFGHLAVISAVILTGPLFSALMESAVQKKRPSMHQIAAFLCLLLGMGFVLLESISSR